MSKQFVIHAGFALLLAFSGCGSTDPTGEVVPTVSASGHLRFRGKPLPFYQITVVPDGKRPAVGVTDKDGAFVLGTNRPDDGAIAGTHPVAVRYVGPPSTNPDEGMTTFTSPPPPPVKIERKYQNAKTSGLSVEIPAGGTTTLEIELK